MIEKRGKLLFSYENLIKLCLNIYRFYQQYHVKDICLVLYEESHTSFTAAAAKKWTLNAVC